MKIIGRFIVLIFVAFAMIFSLIFCFDSSDALTNIELIGGWILFGNRSLWVKENANTVRKGQTEI